MKHTLLRLLCLLSLLISSMSYGQSLQCKAIFAYAKLSSTISHSGDYDQRNTERLKQIITKKEDGQPTTIVVLNSLTYVLQGIKKIKGVEYYAARLVAPAILEVINNPHVTVIYPTIFKLQRAEILHGAEPLIQKKLSENTQLKREDIEQDLLSRFIPISAGRLFKGWLTERLLKNSSALDLLRSLTEGKNAYVQAYYATPAELELVRTLNIPIFSSPDFNGKYSGKSGNQKIMDAAGASSPRARIDLTNRLEFSKSIHELWKDRGITKFVVKVEQGAAGQGNANYTLTPQLIQKIKTAKTDGEAFQIISSSLYKDLKPEGNWSSQNFWDIEFRSQKIGMIQEFLPGMVSSPSAQILVSPFGEVSVISTHEQIFDPKNPAAFTGSRSPAKKIYRDQIEKEASAIGTEMARRGFIGNAGIDFIFTSKNELVVIEINTRMSGTSHPQYMIRGLEQIPTNKNSNSSYYRSTDAHISHTLKNYKSIYALLNDPQIKPLLYNSTTKEGVLFHNLGSHRIGKIGFTAFSRSRQRSEKLFKQMESILQ